MSVILKKEWLRKLSIKKAKSNGFLEIFISHKKWSRLPIISQVKQVEATQLGLEAGKELQASLGQLVTGHVHGSYLRYVVSDDCKHFVHHIRSPERSVKRLSGK